MAPFLRSWDQTFDARTCSWPAGYLKRSIPSQVMPGAMNGSAARRQLGSVLGEKNLRAAIGQAVLAADRQRGHPRIVGQSCFLHVDMEAGLDCTRRKARIGMLEMVSLLIGLCLHCRDCALGTCRRSNKTRGGTSAVYGSRPALPFALHKPRPSGRNGEATAAISVCFCMARHLTAHICKNWFVRRSLTGLVPQKRVKPV